MSKAPKPKPRQLRRRRTNCLPKSRPPDTLRDHVVLFAPLLLYLAKLFAPEDEVGRCCGSGGKSRGGDGLPLSTAASPPRTSPVVTAARINPTTCPRCRTRSPSCNPDQPSCSPFFVLWASRPDRRTTMRGRARAAQGGMAALAARHQLRSVRKRLTDQNLAAAGSGLPGRGRKPRNTRSGAE